MKKLIAVLLCLALVLMQAGFTESAPVVPDTVDPAFESLSDPELLQYMEDQIYASLDGGLGSDDYVIEDISSVYISQEYLEELAFNTRPNVYFGYTLAELDAAFEGKRYIFTCDENGETVVQEFVEIPDNTDAIMLKNIAIGTGVILFCVTVSVISGGLAAPGATAGAAVKVSMIFSAAAESATQMAVSGAVIGAASQAVVTGIRSGDMYETVRAAKLGATEGFKWGAISGAVIGGAKEAIRIAKASGKIPSPYEAEENVATAYNCSEEQVTYLDGERVPYGTIGATRPDGIRLVDGHYEAIEVKRYDLLSQASRDTLQRELIRQVTQRCTDLPAGWTQRVVLDVEGRGYTKEFVERVVNWVKNFLDPICPGIPVDTFGGVI